MFKYIFFAILGAVVYFLFFFDMQLTNQMIGNLFIGTIMSLFVVFLFFKFGLHYKIESLNRFATAFYYAVFEYKKIQTKPSDLTYVESIREQAEVALAANFDPTLSTSELKIPVSLYSGKDPYLDKLRAKIQEAENLKLNARNLNTKADIILDKTHDDLVEKNLVSVETPKQNYHKGRPVKQAGNILRFKKPVGAGKIRIPVECDPADNFIIRGVTITMILKFTGRQVNNSCHAIYHTKQSVE